MDAVSAEERNECVVSTAAIIEISCPLGLDDVCAAKTHHENLR